MSTGNITIRAVAALEPGDALWDTGVRGFGVRRQRGEPVYVLKYRSAGRQRFVTIGRHGSPWTPDAARREARRLLGLVAEGKDPAFSKAQARIEAADTLGGVIERYLRHAKQNQKPRTFLETERHLLVGWRPLHSTRVSETQRRHVAARLAELADASHARAALSACLNWAVGEGLAETNPVMGTNRPAQRSRDRVLADTEIAAIWSACRDDDYGRIVKLLLLTGQRRDEVGGMRWAELDFDRGVWIIPGARTKNHREHVVPLTEAMVRIIPERRREEFVFGDGPRRNGDPARGFSGWSKAKAALDGRIGGAADWRLHDLRRTTATRMADLGVQPHVIEAVLNHVSGYKAGVAGVYNRSTYANEKRGALDLWGEHVAAIAKGRAANVAASRGVR